MSTFAEDPLILFNVDGQVRLDQYLGLLRREKVVCEQRVAQGSIDCTETEVLFDRWYPVFEYDRDAMRPYKIITRFNHSGRPVQQEITGPAQGWTKYPAYDLYESMLYDNNWELISRTKSKTDVNDLADSCTFNHVQKPFRVLTNAGINITVINLSLDRQ